MTKAQQIAQGRRVLKDWLGEGGKTVPLEVAQSRTNTCLNCPKNYHGAWMWNIATSLAIASQMKLRKTMDIRLEGEEKLDVCEVCGCVLKLKVHVPFIHIYRHTSLEQFAIFPEHCWQIAELKTIQQTPP